MTLNGLLALILRYFAEFGSFLAHYVKVVEYTPILSATKM